MPGNGSFTMLKKAQYLLYCAFFFKKTAAVFCSSTLFPFLQAARYLGFYSYLIAIAANIV
jgi:hypothetical protein